MTKGIRLTWGLAAKVPLRSRQRARLPEPGPSGAAGAEDTSPAGAERLRRGRSHAVSVTMPDRSSPAVKTETRLAPKLPASPDGLSQADWPQVCSGAGGDGRRPPAGSRGGSHVAAHNSSVWTPTGPQPSWRASPALPELAERAARQANTNTPARVSPLSPLPRTRRQHTQPRRRETLRLQAAGSGPKPLSCSSHPGTHPALNRALRRAAEPPFFGRFPPPTRPRSWDATQLCF